MNDFKMNISYFENEINILKQNGFNPIAVCRLLCEDTFVFNTEKEAKKAYSKLEIKEKQIQGFFYGKRKFKKTVEQYQKQFDCQVDVFLLQN